MRVTGLYVYPIKSCGGVRLERAQLTRAGLQHDRWAMVVDEQGRFLSQRTHPALGRVRTQLEPDGVRASAPEGEVFLPFTWGVEGSERRPVEIWSRDAVGVVHEPASQLFREVLGLSGASLVVLPPGGERPVNPRFGQPDDRVGFADAYPLLLLGDASVRDLEARARVTLDVRRFRPNVTMDGAAYAEDRLARFTLGGVRFRGPKRCDRCVLTTLDPDTQARGPEPLRTLARYRRGADGKVYFGMNVIPDGAGTLAVGDELTDIVEQEPNP